MKGKNNLVKAHILLQCADAKHEGMCAELRDALVNNFNEVKEADIITQIPGDADFCVTGDTDFCVTGIAKINPDKERRFKAALEKLQANSKENSKVKNVRIHIEAR